MVSKFIMDFNIFKVRITYNYTFLFYITNVLFCFLYSGVMMQYLSCFDLES